MSRPFTTDEIKRLYSCFIGRYEARNKTVFICQMYIGARISDILNLTINDVSSASGIRSNITIIESKTNKKKKVQISGELKKHLQNWLDCRIKVNRAKPSSFLFVSERGGRLSYNAYLNALHTAAKASELEYIAGEIGTHGIRKWYGNAILNQEISAGSKFIDAAQTVRKLFNHDSFGSTTHYLGLDEENTTTAGVNHSGVAYV